MKIRIGLAFYFSLAVMVLSNLLIALKFGVLDKWIPCIKKEDNKVKPFNEKEYGHK